MLSVFVSQGASVINYSSMEGIEVSLSTEQNQAISTLTIKVFSFRFKECFFVNVTEL